MLLHKQQHHPKHILNKIPDISETSYRGWCLMKNIPIDKKIFNKKCKIWGNCKHFIHRKWTRKGGNI